MTRLIVARPIKEIQKMTQYEASRGVGMLVTQMDDASWSAPDVRNSAKTSLMHLAMIILTIEEVGE